VVLQVMPHATPNPLPGTPAGCAWLHYGGPSDRQLQASALAAVGL